MYFINGHEIVLDRQEKLDAWASPDRVVRLAMDFIKNCPLDEKNSLPWYLQYSCFWTDPLRPTIWPDNPAGKFAWAVTTLLKYYPYSGDEHFIEITRTMLDRLLEFVVPEQNDWAGSLYSSAEPGTGVYGGARADGEFATEPDKVAQVGRALVDFYEMTGDEKYLHAGKDCADSLIRHLREGDANHSPVPFRVDVRDGRIIEEYTSDMIPLVRLFDELSRLGVGNYSTPSQQVLDWIYRYPMQNNLWKGYFEDIRLDPDNGNRDQLSPLETARYLLNKKPIESDWLSSVPGLIEWVKKTLGAPLFFSAEPIHEQKYCFFVMGSHTARYASLCAQWSQASGDATYRERAIRTLNWASYMVSENGTVTVGVDRPDYYNQCWFTDGYFDYVPHFIDCMAAIPTLAPADMDHLLESSSVVKHIEYRPNYIHYQTFDREGWQILRLSFIPKEVKNGRTTLVMCESIEEFPGWTFEPKEKVLKIHHQEADIEIIGDVTSINGVIAP
ncbi:MAG: hypothetical protein C0410_02155 [Anaerolinea sp.]|nr:hypothetical protein [Anaerolinea sp.]